MQTLNYSTVNKAFSKQSYRYDEEDRKNPILTAWRKQVHTHLDRFLKPGSYILELNAGTGIDAVHFAKQGHRIHAIDIADGMIEQLQKKAHEFPAHLTCQQLSFEELNKLFIQPVDCIFSNFGGLNCTQNLAKVSRYIPSILKPGGYIIWVIMPPISFWEWLWVFKGHIRKAFRRLNKNGATAHLEGEYFTTYYHSLGEIKKALGGNFKFIASEGLGALSPPPSKTEFVAKHPWLYNVLMKLDNLMRSNFPFNRWADHIIVTFQFVK
jgi:ubiquinone/menaquinone biosynthesis C-methylase UbiE